MPAPGFSPSGDFLHRRLAAGVDLFLHPTRRFKTARIQACLAQPLTEGNAAAMSLAASVLKQGTADRPSRRALYGALDDLHGAEMDLDTVRIGEAHVLEAELEMPSDRFSGERGALGKGIALLAEVLGRPRMEGRGLPGAILRQERRNLREALAAVINHKPSYATLRCLKAACPREPYRIGRLGTREALGKWHPEALAAFWRDAVSRLPMALYAVGDFDPGEMADRLAGALLPLRRGTPRPRPSGGFRLAFPKVPVEASERAAVSQVRLCLAFRTNIAWNSEAAGALTMAQMVLGGGSHAKLFREVREKASLAYDAYASLERTKGLLLVSAGVDPAQRERAEAILLEQVEALRRGSISEREWTDSRKSLLNAIRTARDSSARMVAAHLEGWINGSPRSAAESRRRILAVTPDAAAAAARRLAHAATFRLLDRRRART